VATHKESLEEEEKACLRVRVTFKVLENIRDSIHKLKLPRDMDV